MAFGDPVHGEVDSADASGGVTVLLYKDGSTTAYTLTSKERLSITDIIFISTSGGTYDLSFGTEAAGTRIVGGIAEAKGGLGHRFMTPITGPKGVAPILTENAGQVNLTISGFVF